MSDVIDTPVRCIVKGCLNHKHHGNFVGDLCSPCYTMLTEGHISPSTAWFVITIRSLRLTLEDIKNRIEENRYGV